MGFGSVILVFGLAVSLAFVALTELRRADGVRDAVYTEARRSTEIARGTDSTRLTLAAFLLDGNGASRDRFIAELSVLGQRLEGLPGAPEPAELQGLTDRMVKAMADRTRAAAELVEALSGVAAPVTALGELVARNDIPAATGQSLGRVQTSIATLSATAGRFIGTERAADLTAHREAAQRLGAALAQLLALPDLPARVQRQATVATTALAAEQRAMEGLVAANTARDAAQQALLARLADVAQQAVAGNAAATEAFEAASTVASDALRSVVIMLISGGAAATLLGCLMAWGIGRSIAAPLRRLQGSMLRIADGHLEESATGEAWTAEVSAMATALEGFRLGLARSRELEDEAVQLRAKAEVDREALVAELARELRSSLGDAGRELTSAVDGLRDASDGLGHLASGTVEEIERVNMAADQSAGSVQTVAAATEQLASSIQEIATRTSESTGLVRNVVADAGRMEGMMAELAQSSEQIGEVIGVISGIAAQTNLLALNAMIEAARAGEFGYGFAVVANEVKQLAEKSARSTDRIGGQIGAIQATIGRTEDAISRIAEQIRGLETVSASIASAIDEQQATTREIARSVAVSAEMSDQVRNSVNRISDGAARVNDAANGLRSAASGLNGASQKLDRDLNAVVERLEAA